MKPSCLSPAQYKPTCPTYFCFVNKVIQTSPEFVMVIICQGSKCQVDFVNFFSVGRVVASNTRGPGTCLIRHHQKAKFSNLALGWLHPDAVIRHDGDLHAVGWGEGPRPLPTAVKSSRVGVGLKKQNYFEKEAKEVRNCQHCHV